LVYLAIMGMDVLEEEEEVGTNHVGKEYVP
jgi:hypothetical protein